MNKTYVVSFRYGLNFGRIAAGGDKKEYHNHASVLQSDSKHNAFNTVMESFINSLSKQNLENLTYIGDIRIHD